MAAAWQQLTNPTERNTELKVNSGLADVVFSTEKVIDGMGLKNNHYLMTFNRQGSEEEKEGFLR